MRAAAEPPAGDTTLLQVEAVSKRFKAGSRLVDALTTVSLCVRKGTVTGLIGPDGAGKTTLMRAIAGLLRPDAGHIRVLGIDVARDPLSVQRAIGYMPQRFGLYEDLTVRENLDLYADLQGVPEAARASRYAELLGMTGLTPFPERLAGRLSGGMKQKLGLACALLRPPQLLLLDEPTVGVDPISRRDLWTIVYRLVQQEQTTVLLSTAYLDEAERCHEVVLLHRGAVLGQGTPQSFSATMTGRCFRASTPKASRRDLQASLSGLPGVIDATLHPGGVRVLTAQAAAPDSALLPAGTQIEPLPPRFEDAFVARLNTLGGHTAVPRPAAPVRPAPGADSMIAVENVTRYFGDFCAVDHISFTVAPGEVFGLLGANGAGKSTTFRMLCGLLPASGGHLRVAGKDLRHAPAEARAHIGYMAQRFSLYADLSVSENLAFFGSVYGLRGRTRNERTAWALDEFDLRPYATALPAQLPLGYKQRLALAAALMHRPPILFLDEPTSGVDPLARREFWLRIGQLAREGVTILVTTHFLEEAEYCDRLVIMSEGRLLAEDTPERLRDRVRSAELPHPTIEDAFIRLTEAHLARSTT